MKRFHFFVAFALILCILSIFVHKNTVYIVIFFKNKPLFFDKKPVAVRWHLC